MAGASTTLGANLGGLPPLTLAGGVGLAVTLCSWNGEHVADMGDFGQAIWVLVYLI